jgi:hypothetical protein
MDTDVRRWISISIVVGAGVFIFALFISAVFEPQLRPLHALQALIYIAVIVLAHRNSAWGFGAGCFISVFWNYSVIRGTAEQLWAFLTGRLLRPDLAIQLLAVAAHFLLIVACAAGFVRSRPGEMRWAKFAAGGALAIGYLVLIIITTGPEYMIPLLKRTFGM